MSERRMAKPLAWITGAGGLIGGYVARAAAKHAPTWAVCPLGRQDLDLADTAALRRRFEADQPLLVIHCAGLTSNPGCTANPRLARELNVEVTRTLAELCARIPLVFFSTDLVFDGRKGYYDEAASPNPLGVYAETKLEAEAIVGRNPRHSIIRTSLNGGVSPGGNRGFNEQMRNAWRAGRALSLFVDEYRAPIFAGETARAVWELVAANRPGLYHVAGSERLSRWEIGKLMAARWPQLAPKIQAGTLADSQGPPRAPDTTLNCAKAQRLLSFDLPAFSGWLRDHPDVEL